MDAQKEPGPPWPWGRALTAAKQCRGLKNNSQRRGGGTAAETLEFLILTTSEIPKIFSSTVEMEELQLPDIVDEDVIEYYDDPDELALYKEYEDMLKYGRFFYMFKSCVGPTTFQTFDLVGPLIAMCLILRVISLLKLPTLLVHFVSFVCGTGALLLFVKKNMVYPLTMCALGYPVLFVKNGKRGMVMALTSVTFLIVWYGACMILGEVLMGNGNWNHVLYRNPPY